MQNGIKGYFFPFNPKIHISQTCVKKKKQKKEKKKRKKELHCYYCYIN